MIVQIAKWGNSLAVRIPAAHAKEVGLTANGKAEIAVREGRLVLSPVTTEASFDLDSLVAGITDDNRHEEIDAGPARGREFR